MNSNVLFGKGSRMKKICTVMAICIVGVSIFGCSRSRPIMNIDNNTIPSLNDGSSMSLEVVKNAILTACGRRGWTTKVKDGNVIEANVVVREHQATIEIPFSQNSYSIVYKDSEGLRYQGSGTIHKNYNGWITMLSASIQQELGMRSQYSR